MEIELIKINDKLRSIKSYENNKINVILLNNNKNNNEKSLFPIKKDIVSILYIARFHGGIKHNEIFDKCLDKNKPFIFEIDKKNKNDKKKLSVIKGINDGVKQLKVGDKAIIQIPYDLGYGDRHPTDKTFPKKQDLTFEVELLEIKKSK